MMIMAMATKVVARKIKKEREGGTTPGMKLPSRKSLL